MAEAPQFPARATYAPEAFDVLNEPMARSIILTPEYGHSTDHRWATETPYLADLLSQFLAPTKDMVILDYGCGIGRLAKELIDRHGCLVIGVDISLSMRVLAEIHVKSDRFVAVSPAMFETLLARGLACDASIAIWVLQHCFAPDRDIALLRRALKPGAKLAVVNTVVRSVPTRELGFGNDGLDILDLLRREFRVAGVGKLSAEVLAAKAVEGSFIAQLTNDLVASAAAVAHG
jgi:SAM-dependent methyltransferase